MALPFADDSVDICLSSNVAEHVPRPWQLGGEMLRVTRPGGLAVLSYTVWLGPFGGHEMGLTHYLGGERAAAHYARKHGHPAKNNYGSSLFAVSAADGLSWAENTGAAIRAFPRYHPRWAWWLTSVPVLRELTVSNLGAGASATRMNMFSFCFRLGRVAAMSEGETRAKTEYDKLFIGGKWTEPSTSEVIEVHCPATGEYVGKVPMAAATDVDAAVAAARAAFDNGPWPTTPPKERAAVIANVVKLMEERKELLSTLLASETGQPPTTIETMHWMGSMGAMNFFAGPAVDQIKWREVRNGPYGQTNIIASRSAWSARSSRGTCRCSSRSTSWARPCWPVAPGAQAGRRNAMTTNALADIFAEACLPGRALGGARRGGDRTCAGLTPTSTRSPSPAAPPSAARSADRRRAAQAVRSSSAANRRPSSSRTSTSRRSRCWCLRAHEHRPGARWPDPHPRAALALRRDRRGGQTFVRALPVGGPSDHAAQIGSQITEKQRERVHGYIAKGAEGARDWWAARRPEGLDRGWFVEPTMFADVDNKMTIAREEIFGPAEGDPL